MALLLLAVLLLPTGYAVFHAIDQYRHQGEQQQSELERTARLIADHQANTLSNIRAWLEQSARVDALPRPGPECNATLDAKRQEIPLVIALSLVSVEGRVRCSAAPENVGIDLTDRFWFQRAVRGSPFTISEMLTTRGSGNLTTFVLAVPIYIGEDWLTDPWEPEGVLAAALDLEAFAMTWRNLDLPRGAEIYLSDRLGQRVPPLPWASDSPDRPAIEALLSGERESVEVSMTEDSEEALLARASVGFTGLQVVVAAPTRSLGWRRSEVLIPILLPALMLLVGVAAIFAGTHLVVNRHVERLAQAVRGHRPGSPGLSLATANAPNELQELGARFAELAQQLEEREELLRRMVAQKDLLLREVNHRVKNNLQVVASLLRMRARGRLTEESRAAIRDAHSRIEAIALVHRRIYEEGAVEQVELNVFLGELLDHLRESIGNEHIEIDIGGDIAGVRLATDRAVSLALLLTELVTNAIEHAFVGRDYGRIRIGMDQSAEDVRFTVADDGVGFDPEAHNSGTGIHLAELLARQMGGSLTFTPGEAGTRVDLSLPLGKPGNRSAVRAE